MIRCADDFGMSPEIDGAILSLLESGKLNAVSVMSLKATPVSVARLRKLKSKVKVGLHLDLFSSPLILFSRSKIRTEIERQIRFFYSKFGFYPAFFDGHMHCHVYPVIRSEYCAAIARVAVAQCFVRSLTLKPEMHKGKSLKDRLYLKWLAWLNVQFLALLKSHKLRTNDFIYGVFNGNMAFSEALSVAQNFEGEENSLLFCHPGIVNDKSILRKSEYELIKNL